ncbi:MAG: hypothetical protein BWK80_02250 [Desulfobacteraceae bacterium IS3]|nr:MAG: hypothetical protein BWK80_02250 [Desulfobacteraceae bacterium IS3]
MEKALSVILIRAPDPSAILILKNGIGHCLRKLPAFKAGFKPALHQNENRCFLFFILDMNLQIAYSGHSKISLNHFFRNRLCISIHL